MITKIKNIKNVIYENKKHTCEFKTSDMCDYDDICIIINKDTGEKYTYCYITLSGLNKWLHCFEFEVE